MATKHSIFNLAAGFCGEPPLQTVDEDCEAGRQLRAFWSGTVLYCIEAYAWNFLEARAELSRLSVTPAWGYDYYYALPADCERILRLNTSGLDKDDSFTAWQEESGKIACSEPELYLRYVSSARKEQPGYWSETFAHWLAAELGLRIAPKVAADKVDVCVKLAKKYRIEAKTNDASGNPRRAIPPGSWSRAPRSRNTSEQGR